MKSNEEDKTLQPNEYCRFISYHIMLYSTKPILQPNSGTKMCLICDSSAKTTSSILLNNTLIVGPTIRLNLILIRLNSANLKPQTTHV